MALTRLINGKRVEIPAQEEAAIRAEWNSYVPSQPPVAPLSTEELYTILEAKGVLVKEDRPRPKPNHGN